MADKATIENLRQSVYEYRKQILKLCHKCGGLHIGGDLSCAEMLVALYMHTLRIDPKNPHWEDRDRFILSKGHGGAAWYLAMAMRGFFSMEELFNTYKGYETRFGAHPCKAACDVLDSSSGSLGHGLPIAEGMAMAARLKGKEHRVFCMVGDGESNEGTIWEAALASPRFKLGNLIVVLDRNKMSLDDFTEKLLPLEPYADKWRAFRWNTIVIDGNDLQTVVETFDNLPPPTSDVPTVVIGQTIKGKGVSFMESNAPFHHAKIDDEQLRKALSEIETEYAKGGQR
jgi:transketolase